MLSERSVSQNDQTDHPAQVEADQTLSGSFQAVNAATFGIKDHTDAEVIYHLVMLVEAGFLVGNTLRPLLRSDRHLQVSRSVGNILTHSAFSSRCDVRSRVGSVAR
jgi:hypothetical protein